MHSNILTKKCSMQEPRTTQFFEASYKGVVITMKYNIDWQFVNVVLTLNIPPHHKVLVSRDFT